ncbi:hypothetical protein, partial [Salmonella sp. s51228]|uniref:hypothetical protein n=1 Tax=Salmonella sp. s51228 TaxID=3159652 RepID=UPI0039809A35
NNYTTNGFDVCPNEVFSIQLIPNGFILEDIIIVVFQFGFINNAFSFAQYSATVTINNFVRKDCVLPGSNGMTVPVF